MTNRILEAHARGYWNPDPDMLASLRDAGDEMEDRLEGAIAEVA
jgi:magnesium chelatase subunit H